MKALRRIGVALGALLAVLALVLVTSGSAIADDSGISPQGFNRFQYQDAFYKQGNAWYQYDAYRRDANTITFQWWISGSCYQCNPGTMTIHADTPGAAYHNFNSYHLGGGQVFYAHISAQLAYSWSFNWQPVSPGGAHVVFTARL